MARGRGCALRTSHGGHLHTWIHPGLHQQSLLSCPLQPTPCSPTGRTAADPLGACQVAQESRCEYLLPRGFPEPGDRDKGLSPSLPSHTHLCACAHILLATSSIGWGLNLPHSRTRGGGGAPTSEQAWLRGEEWVGEGTAGQVALLRSWHPPANPLLLSFLGHLSGQDSGYLKGLGLNPSLHPGKQAGEQERGRFLLDTHSRGRGRTKHPSCSSSKEARQQRDQAYWLVETPWCQQTLSLPPSANKVKSAFL